MLVLDKHNRSEKLLNVIKMARDNISSWHLGYIKITHGSKNKIDVVVNSLKDSYSGLAGALFKVEDHKVIVLVELGPIGNYSKLSLDTRKDIANVGCNVSFRALTTDILDSMETDFVLRDGNLQQTFYDERLKRIENKILIIEDDAFAGAAVQQLTQKYGDVTLEAQPTDIEDLYASVNPDFVLLDIELQDMNGLDLLEQIFVIDPDAFVVMLSAYSNQQNILKSCSLGAAGFVTKPVDEESLLKYMTQCTTMLNIF